MTRQTIKGSWLQTICWHKGKIVDWANAGNCYSLNGEHERLAKFTYAFSFDGCVTSPDGTYAFIYKKLGTKGLLLKNGDVLREINRTYYHAESYEYPAAFVVYNNETYLAHCPISYDRLDFEHAETGEIVTNVPDRKPTDVFHSRLTVSADKKYLMVCGWYWHPRDTVELFDITECFNNPHLLDKSSMAADFNAEMSSASFIDNTRVLLGSSNEEPFDDEAPIFPQKHIAIWDLTTNELSKPVKVNGEFGNLIAINDKLAWDLYKFPKIIDIQTGEVISKAEDINSGSQQSSIISTSSDLPQISFDRETGKLAILKSGEQVEVLSAE